MTRNHFSKYVFTCLVIIFLFSCQTLYFWKEKRETSIRIIELKEKKLVSLARRLIEMQADSSADKYKNIHAEFLEALTGYLDSRGDKKSKLLFLHHPDIILVLPVYSAGEKLFAESASQDKLSILWPQMGPEFNGEILDLAIVDSEREKTVLALFSDSLVILPWSKDSYPNFHTIHFSHEAKASVFPMWSDGFIMNTGERDQQNRVSVFSTRLHYPLMVEWNLSTGNYSVYQKSEYDSIGKHLWDIIPGKPIYKFKPFHEGPVRSFQHFPENDLTVVIDTLGYVHAWRTKKESREWVSERIWGNKLYPLIENKLAVVNDQQRSFIVFDLTDFPPRLLGQSPYLPGKVTAISSSESQHKKMIIVATVSGEESGRLSSHINVLNSDFFNWVLPVNYSERQFPDYDSKIYVPLETNQPRSDLFDFTNLPHFLRSTVFETIYSRNSRNNLVSNLATICSSDSSHRRWDIHLMEDLRFADGSPCYAEDIVDSWQKSLKQCAQRSCPRMWLHHNLVGLEDYLNSGSSKIRGLQVIDSLTIRINLYKPRLHFASELTLPEFSVFKNSGNNRFPMGTGPFSVKTLEGSPMLFSAQLERNKYFHHGYPFLRGVSFVFGIENVKDVLHETELTASILSRKIDVNFFRQIEDIETKPFPESDLYFLVMNPETGALKEKEQRRLIVRSLDLPVLASLINDGICEPAGNMFFDTEYHHPEEETVEKSGQFEKLKIFYPDSDPVAAQIAERLHTRLTQLKISHQVPRAFDPPDIMNISESTDYDILIDSYHPEGLPPQYQLANLLNRGYIIPDSFEVSLEKIINLPENSYATRIEKKLIDESIIFPLLKVRHYAAYTDSLRDLNLSGTASFNFSRTWVPQR